nr:CopD family protein [Auraticoccus cholistanensis]
MVATTPSSGTTLDRAPEQVVLQFSEPVRLVPDGIRLVGADGTPRAMVATARGEQVTAEVPADATGTLVVSWRVVSGDSHPVSGALVVTVGASTGPVLQQPVELAGSDRLLQGVGVAATALQHLAGMTLAGLVLFGAVVARRHPSGTAPRRLLVALAAAASLGVLAGAAVTGLRISGGGLAAVTSPADWLPLVPAPTLATVGATLAGGWLVVALHGDQPSRRRRRAALAAGAVTVVAPVLSGHTVTVEPRWLGVAADAVHLAVGATWLGGLVGLVLLVRRSLPGAGGVRDGVALARVTARFSALAGWSVLALGVSGVTLAALVLPGWSALLGTGYGRSLVVKLSLVAVVLGVASWNRQLLVPRVRRAPDAPAAWSAFRRLMLVEVALLVAVLLATGALTSLDPGGGRDSATPATTAAAPTPAAPPTAPTPAAEDHAGGHDGHGPAGRTLAVRRTLADGGELTGSISPVLVGTNTLRFEVRDADGRLLRPEQPPTVRVRLDSRDLGPLSTTATAEDGGRWRADLDLPLGGEWTVEVAVRTSTFSEPVASFAVIAV